MKTLGRPFGNETMLVTILAPPFLPLRKFLGQQRRLVLRDDSDEELEEVPLVKGMYDADGAFGEDGGSSNDDKASNGDRRNVDEIELLADVDTSALMESSERLCSLVQGPRDESDDEDDLGELPTTGLWKQEQEENHPFEDNQDAMDQTSPNLVLEQSLQAHLLLAPDCQNILDWSSPRLPLLVSSMDLVDSLQQSQLAPSAASSPDCFEDCAPVFYIPLACVFIQYLL